MLSFSFYMECRSLNRAHTTNEYQLLEQLIVPRRHVLLRWSRRSIWLILLFCHSPHPSEDSCIVSMVGFCKTIVASDSCIFNSVANVARNTGMLKSHILHPTYYSTVYMQSYCWRLQFQRPLVVCFNVSCGYSVVTHMMGTALHVLTMSPVGRLRGCKYDQDHSTWSMSSPVRILNLPFCSTHTHPASYECALQRQSVAVEWGGRLLLFCLPSLAGYTKSRTEPIKTFVHWCCWSTTKWKMLSIMAGYKRIPVHFVKHCDRKQMYFNRCACTSKTFSIRSSPRIALFSI